MSLFEVPIEREADFHSSNQTLSGRFPMSSDRGARWSQLDTPCMSSFSPLFTSFHTFLTRYGSSANLVLSTGFGVNGYTLDAALGEFILTHPDVCPTLLPVQR